MNQTGDVRVGRQGGVQVVRLNRPDKKNAITRPMYAALTAALVSGDADPDVHVHLFLGVPGAFSAGNDLADFLAAAEGGDLGTEVWDFVLALAAVAKPSVSGVDGIAVGIGTTLHLHCDLTLATPRTRFHTPFVDLGLVPEAASSLLLPRRIGHQRACAMRGLGEPLTAADAAAAGLIHAVVDEDRLEEEALALARRLAAKPPEALRITRDLMRGSREEVLARIREEAERFRARLKSREARAAFEAFLSRKKGG